MWVSRQEWKRHCRELSEAKARADAAEQWSRGLVNSFLTSNNHHGVPLPVMAAEKHYTPTPALPNTVQGWTQDEFVDALTADGTYKSRGEALEAWKSAQRTGRFAYQNNEEFLA